MPALTSVRRTQLRQVVAVCLFLIAVGTVGFASVYRHYVRRVDRLLTHSPAFAARPRVQVVRAPGRRSPLLLTAGALHRPQRRVPAFDALPPELVAAVVSIEDRRFFEHGGINYGRTAECAVQDALSFHMACGGSTLTQQLARVEFLSQRKTFRRKLEELVIARRLEQRLTKQQIFAMYAAQINLGQQGPAPIKGFRQAAQVYFGKDLRQLDLAQDALLAGMIHAPNFDNPYRHPDRATRRRNVVLDTMVDTGAITRTEAEAAQAEPLLLADRSLDGNAPDAEPSVADDPITTW